MAVVKAKPKIQKAKPKPKRGRPPKGKEKPKVPPKPKEPSIGHLIFKSVVETLEHNALGGGEFDLPSILTRTLDKSDPKFSLGLHREYYIPLSGTAPFYQIGGERIRTLLLNQASMVMPAFTEGVKVKKDVDFDLPLCKGCR